MRTALLLALCACLMSCSTSSDSGATADSPHPARHSRGHGPRDVPGSEGEASPELPPGHPPMDGPARRAGMPSDAVHGGGGMPMGEMPADEPQGGGAAGPDLQWQAQEGWRSVRPSSSMRVAEWALAKVDSDAEDASLVVFHFPGGGDVQSNLDRWYGQFEQPDGRPSSEVARVANRTVAGLRVTVADVSGTFSGGMMGMGGGQSAAKPNFRLLAALVETYSGPWFFKLTGPKDTVEHWHASFDLFLGTLHR